MEDNQLGIDVLESFVEEIAAVDQHERSLVIITTGYIELFLNRIIDKKCKHGKKRITKNNRDYPLSVKLTLLNEIGLLDNELFQILDNFRKIRNRAAHEASFLINDNEWKYLNKGLDRFIVHESMRKPYDLPNFCKFLMGTIWTENIPVLKDINL